MDYRELLEKYDLLLSENSRLIKENDSCVSYALDAGQPFYHCPGLCNGLDRHLFGFNGD